MGIPVVIVTDFVNDLIAGNFPSESSIVERARYLGYDLTKRHGVLIVNVDNFPVFAKEFKGDERKILRFKTRLSEAINRVLRDSNISGVVSVQSENIIIFVALNSKMEAAETANIARMVQEQVRPYFSQITISVGMGRICRTLLDFAASYQEALNGLENLAYNQRWRVFARFPMIFFAKK